MEKKKKKTGRPSKLTEKYIEAAKQVLGLDSPDSISAIIYTDEELIMLINEKLLPGERINERTFRDWKARKIDNHLLSSSFLPLVKKALTSQKDYLFQKYQNDPIWQKWAWIIERKFTDWDIRLRWIEKQKEGNVEQIADLSDIADAIRTGDCS